MTRRPDRLSVTRADRVSVTRPCQVCGIQTRSRKRLCPDHQGLTTHGRIHDDALATIRRMAAAGRSDREIGVALGLARNTVCAARLRHGIPPGVPVSNTVLAEPRRPTTSSPPGPATLPPGEQEQAACRHVDPDLFFEAPQERGTTPTSHERVQRAKGVCSGCPIQLRCLQVALANDERHGIWGGTTAEDRNRLRQVRGQVAS